MAAARSVRLMQLPDAVDRAIDTALDRMILPGYTSIGLAVRRRLDTWPDDPGPAALAGRDVLVTGGSSGLGAQTVADLAALGAHVHVVVRSEDKAREALTELGVLDRCTLWRCDLGDLGDVRDLADRLVTAKVALRGIVHNAGVMPPERSESPQGHELSMAVHLLGPVLLTELLQPVLELELRGQDDPVRGIGSGLSSAEAGLRLRYEITRRFAPYLGVVHERTFGGTADYRRDEGEATRETRWVAGVRWWF